MIQVYITSAYRAYELADHYRRRGAYVVPGRPARDLAAGGGRARTPTPSSSGPARTPGRSSSPTSAPAARSRVYRSTVRTLDGLPPHPPRPDQAPPLPRAQLDRGLARLPARLRLLLQGRLLRGRPVASTPSASTTPSPRSSGCPGRHLYFLDDHLFGDARFAAALFDGMRGMGRLWQAAGTVQVGAAARPAREGRRLRAAQPVRRLRDARARPTCARSTSTRTSTATTARPSRRLHDLGVMVNGSFVFGMDDDDAVRLRRARSSGRSRRASRPRPSTS